ncbi:hypothetical protein [Hyphobacterium sp.]|uniref:hypothetical protein n=1 Tax=Hyphobacterium sp. TaxID=2004662 RepID=UPI003BAC4C15
MLKFVTGGAVAVVMAGASLALTPAEEIADRCVEQGNERAQCECAADFMVETLEDNEVSFMMAVMDSDSAQQDPNAMMTLAAEHGLDMAGMVEIGQKMAAAEPEMRETCGIEADQ